ncbi:MAG TPA: Trm112 family protein [bacterium]|nr:Trm112 family protein [bacterium]
MAIGPQLLEILICPQCREKLELSADEQSLLCRRCELQYPIEDGIPLLVSENAKPLEEQK